MASLNNSPSTSQLNLSKGSEEIRCPLESTSPARYSTSKASGFQPEGTSPTASASFKPTDCGFDESETVCIRQNQRPMPWTSSPIVRTNATLVLAEPVDASNGKQLDRNQCKTLDLVSCEPDVIESDPMCGAVQSTDAKTSLAAPKDFRPSKAMDRIKRLFNPHGKKCRDAPKEVGGNALANDEGRDPVRWAATKDRRTDQHKQGDGARTNPTVNKAGSVPVGTNTALELERNRSTEDLDRRDDDVCKERSRNHRINVVEPATNHCKQNWRHGWMFKRQRKKSGESYPTVEVHSSQDGKVQTGAILSACLIQESSTSAADEMTPDVVYGEKAHGENVLNSEMVDNIERLMPRISPTDEVLFLGKQRQVLPEAVLTQIQKPSCSRDFAGNPSSEVFATKSLATIQSIENVERWLMHGYQAPRGRMKSRQHLGRRSRRNFLCYMSNHRSSISSSEYAISPTDDRHRCAWEHCQSEEGFGSNDSYHQNQPLCNDVNIEIKKVKASHASHERIVCDAEGTRHLGAGGAGHDAFQNQSGDDASPSKLNPSLLQFVAELIEGLEKVKHNDSEWSTRLMEKTSTPVVPRVTKAAKESLSSTSKRHCCSRSSAENLNPMLHEADLLQNQNAEGVEGCHVTPDIAGQSEEVAICPGTHSLGLNVNSCGNGKRSEKLINDGSLNRPASLSGARVVHRCTVEQKRTFSVDKLLDDFNSLKIDSRFPPNLRKILPPGNAPSSLLKQCLLQSMEGKPEILSARQMTIPTTACGEDVFQQEKTEIVGHQPFAQLSAGILSVIHSLCPYVIVMLDQ